MPDKWLYSFKKDVRWIRCKDNGILIVWSLREDRCFKTLYGNDFIKYHIIGDRYGC